MVSQALVFPEKIAQIVFVGGFVALPIRSALPTIVTLSALPKFAKA